MSSNLPPSGPPGPPPHPPPSGPPPEYLDSGAGRPLEPEPTAGRSGLKKGLLVGGGVVGLAAVGVGAWAAVSFLATGPQPAEALPGDTLAYLSVDLDPSGGQKIEALRTLNKFPAFEDEVGIDTDDDIRKAIFDEIEGDLDCGGLDYADDIEPWLGDRAAVAAVDTGDEQPSPVFVVQVKDAEQAEDGIEVLEECADDTVGLSVEGDWAVLAETDEIAEEVTEGAADGSLADDEDFQKWTDEAGDSGVVTMYAGPELGDYLADHAEDLFGFPFGALGVNAVDCAAVVPVLPSEEAMPGDETSVDESCVSDGDYTDDEGSDGPAMSDELTKVFEDFSGMAGVVRFDDGAVEVEFASDSKAAATTLLGLSGGESQAGGDMISTLPDDTAFAVGMGFADGWFGDLLAFYEPYFAGMSGGMTVDDMIDELEAETGLRLPDDIETLFGDSAALAVGSDFDPETFTDSTDGSDVPIALKVDGDPDEIDAVLDKLRDQFPDDESLVFDSDSEGDTIVIGPNADFREQVLREGSLGDNEVFEDVVREADDASMVMFVNVNEIEGAIAEALGDTDDDEFLDNLEPISGFGVSGWTDDDVAHSVLRLTTD